jgi:virulence factor Mce-like protein
MSARAALAAVVLGLAALPVAGCGSGDDTLHVSMRMRNSSGLRDGSDVKVGGARVGHVARLELGPRDVVEVELELDADKTRLGRGASVAIRSANLLGQKFVDLRPGDRSAPAGRDVRIPASRISAPVDLDRVYAVLDADTRTRLGVLINEAGIALTGRRADFNALLRTLPADLDRTAGVVRQLAGDNRTLRALAARSGRFVGRIATDRRDLARVVRTTGQTMRSVSARRPQLAAALRRAPGALEQMRRFLADLRATTVPLAPAARALSAAAPSLAGTLTAVRPFRRAAAPTLREARRTAPALTRLGMRATPVVRRARPTVAALSTLVRTAPPLTRALDTGVDDLFGFVQGWARATQARDGAGHVFHGHISWGPEVLRTAVRRILDQQPASGRRRGGAPRPLPRTPPAPATPAPRETPRAAQPPGRPLERLTEPLRTTLDGVGDAIDDLTERLPLGPREPGQDGTRPLLDRLLKP